MEITPLNLVLAGLTILPVGLVWLLGSTTRWGKSLGFHAGMMLGSGALALATWLLEPGIALGFLLVMAISATVGIFRTPIPAWLIRRLSYPSIQAGILTLVGASLLGYGIHRIDADLHQELLESNKLISEIAIQVDLQPASVPMAQTDAGRSIPLWAPSPDSIADLEYFSDVDYLRRSNWEGQLIQTAPADGQYNCHGWVFAGGKCWIRGSAVDLILEDNQYLPTKHPTIGDICVYRDANGEATHSALVRGLGSDGQVLLESKWGKLGRYIHSASEHHAYVGQSYTFYRTSRGSHLIQGLDGMPSGASTGLTAEE
jgi:hypothetical protein